MLFTSTPHDEVPRLEELLMFGLAFFLFAQGDAYNLIHHKVLGITLYVLGSLLATPWLMFTRILIFAHSSFDRILGYGLKHEDAF